MAPWLVLAGVVIGALISFGGQYLLSGQKHDQDIRLRAIEYTHRRREQRVERLRTTYRTFGQALIRSRETYMELFDNPELPVDEIVLSLYLAFMEFQLDPDVSETVFQAIRGKLGNLVSALREVRDNNPATAEQRGRLQDAFNDLISSYLEAAKRDLVEHERLD